MKRELIKQLRGRFPCVTCGGTGKSDLPICDSCMGYGFDWELAYKDVEKLTIDLGKKNIKLTAELKGMSITAGELRDLYKKKLTYDDVKKAVREIFIERMPDGKR